MKGEPCTVKARYAFKSGQERKTKPALMSYSFYFYIVDLRESFWRGKYHLDRVALKTETEMEVRPVFKVRTDFSLESEETCDFFDKLGYPASVSQARRPSSWNYFKMTPILVESFQPPLISFKRDKNIGNFLVRSAFQTSDQPGTFKCARARCKTCPFICNVEQLSGPKRSTKITNHFTCTSANVIYCITSIYKHLRDVDKDDKNAHLNRSLDTLIYSIILSNIWHSAASPYIKEAQKAAKQKSSPFNCSVVCEVYMK